MTYGKWPETGPGRKLGSILYSDLNTGIQLKTQILGAGIAIILGHEIPLILSLFVRNKVQTRDFNDRNTKARTSVERISVKSKTETGMKC